MDYRLRLRELRVDNDLKQREIAKICSVTANEVSHWETLKRGMDYSYIKKLCEYYGVSMDYVFELRKGLEYPDR